MFFAGCSKKGNIALFIFMLIFIFGVLIISAIVGPVGVDFTTAAYEAGESILNQTQSDLDNIQDINVQTKINGTIAGAKTATTDNITVFGGLYKYGWVIVILIVALILFLVTRRQVELGIA